MSAENARENARENENTENKSSTLSVIQEFCEYTSIHGLGRTAGAKYLVQRIAWFLFFLAAFTISAYHLRELYAKYESHPIGTSTIIQSGSNLRFPSVTICNLNPIRKTLLKALPSKDYAKLKNLFEKAEPLLNTALHHAPTLPLSSNSTPVPGILSVINKLLTTDGPSLPNVGNIVSILPTSLINAQSISTPQLGNKMKSIGNKVEGTLATGLPTLNTLERNDDDFLEDIERTSKAFRLEETVSAVLASIDENKLAVLGHQFNDTVVKCSYRGTDCKQSSIARWNTFWHNKYGNCFVFNPGGKMKTLKSNIAGPIHGLSLQLFVDQQNYIEQLSPAAGFKVLVRPQGQMPFPYEDGITVPPGISASFGINKIEIKRDNSREQSRCLDTTTNSPDNLYKTLYGASYSLMACTGSCLAYNQRKYCECIEYSYPRDVATPVCDVLNSSVAKCLSKVQRMNEKHELNCSKECLLPCREESFKITTSMAAWPSKNYEAQATLEANVNPNATKNIQFRDNYLEMRVFFKDLNNEVTEEKSSYGPIDFISDIGGQLGLWLGVSVLAAVEVMEVIILLIVYSCGRKKKIRDREDSIGMRETTTELPKVDT